MTRPRIEPQSPRALANTLPSRKSAGVYIYIPDGDTDFLDIVAGVLQGDTLAPYQFIICQDFVFRTSMDLIKK